MKKRRGFLGNFDTSAAAIPEYLDESARDPNLANENGTLNGLFFKPIDIDMPILDEVPGHLKLATNELIATAAGDAKKSAPKLKLVTMWIVIMWIAFLCGLIALAAYSLAHDPELWNAIAQGQRF